MPSCSDGGSFLQAQKQECSQGVWFQPSGGFGTPILDLSTLIQPPDCFRCLSFIVGWVAAYITGFLQGLAEERVKTLFELRKDHSCMR